MQGRNSRYLLIVMGTLAALLIPGEVLAWGAGIHLEVGVHVLSEAHRLPQFLQVLLESHHYDFLYGCISADITVGKKYTHYLKHCHRWRMGKKILEAAQTDGQRACAYGYLAHLGADTVAHSYFVPYKMMRTYRTTLLKHAYWELRFEDGVAPEIWDLARRIARKDCQANDRMMREVLSDTIFSFRTNKRIFNSIMLLSRLQQWQKFIRSLSRNSRWTLQEEDRQEYLDMAKEAALSVVGSLEGSPYMKADPTGEEAIAAAGVIRKNLRTLWRDKKLSTEESEQLLLELKPRLKEGVTAPDRVRELLSSF